jgi:hypothetical protein
MTSSAPMTFFCPRAAALAGTLMGLCLPDAAKGCPPTLWMPMTSPPGGRDFAAWLQHDPAPSVLDECPSFALPLHR